MKLTVLQWNVWLSERAGNIVNFLKEVDADILCLQEVTIDSPHNPGRDLPKEIAALGYHQYFVPTLETNGHEPMCMGNAIFSKYPIQKNRAVYVQHADDNPEFEDKENRIYLEATLAVADKEPTVGTAHLSWTRGFVERGRKTSETKLLLEAISQAPAPYIFTCDANALPNSTTIQQLAAHLRHAGPSLSKATWTTKRHNFTNITIDTLQYRLDYVFTSPNMHVISSETLATDVSDHLPILTTVDL